MKSKRVLVTGANGQLGRALIRLSRPGWEMHPLSSSQLDIRSWPQVRDTIASLEPDLVIHCAAATNVDRCEREPDWAYDINALGTRHVARAAALSGANMVYVSTNYVFSGDKDEPYHEFDDPAPISIYGHSKLAGERETISATNRSFIVRTASVFYEDGVNFVGTMRRLMAERDRITVVNDQTSNPTYAYDLAAGIAEIADTAPFGTYHVTNSGSTTWHGWAEEIRRITGSDCEVAPIPASEYTRDAQPPANGTMTSLALANLGISLPDWQDALERCIARWPL